MIDYFALALGHGLLAVALFRLVRRDELDVDPSLESLSRGKSPRERRKAAAQYEADTDSKP